LIEGFDSRRLLAHRLLQLADALSIGIPALQNLLESAVCDEQGSGYSNLKKRAHESSDSRETTAATAGRKIHFPEFLAQFAFAPSASAAAARSFRARSLQRRGWILASPGFAVAVSKGACATFFWRWAGDGTPFPRSRSQCLDLSIPAVTTTTWVRPDCARGWGRRTVSVDPARRPLWIHFNLPVAVCRFWPSTRIRFRANQQIRRPHRTCTACSCLQPQQFGPAALRIETSPPTYRLLSLGV